VLAVAGHSHYERRVSSQWLWKLSPL